MGLCEKCAQLMKYLVAFVKRVSADFVQDFKDCVKTISDCCCLRRTNSAPRKSYHPLFKQHERRAARELLQYLDPGSETPLFQNECLQALSVLAASEHRELQESAAVYYLHLSKQTQTPLPIGFLEPYAALLQLNDLDVQRTTSLSLVNLLEGNQISKELVIEMGLLEPILEMLQSGDHTVQSNSCACIAMLACSDSNREAIASADGVLPLMVLAKSYDPRVQQNAVRALLSLTRSESTMMVLCHEGVIPVLALLLQSTDSEVQFYSCSALSNIATVSEHHSKMLCIGDCFLLKSLLSLMTSSVQKNASQACQCLRNLSKNVRTQEQLLGLNVSPLLALLSSPLLSVSESAVMLLSELSAPPLNRLQETLVNEGLLQIAGELLFRHQSSCTVVSHCAVTVTHLCCTAVGQQALMDSECLLGLLQALVSDCAKDEALLHVTSCLHHLASLDSLRSHLTRNMTAEHVATLVRFSGQMENAELSFACASVISKLEINGKVAQLLKPHYTAILEYLLRFLKSREVRFQQLGIATVCNLKKGGGFEGVPFGRALEQELRSVQEQTEQTKQLLQMVQLPSPPQDQH